MGYPHNPYNGVVCNDTITATGVFASKELWRLSKESRFSSRDYPLLSATFGNPNGGLNNGLQQASLGNAIKLETHGGNGGHSYYTCATYGSPPPGSNEQQSLLATTAYSPLSLPLRSVHSPPVTVQSVTGEVLRLKRLRRMSSADEEEADIRDKVAAAAAAAAGDLTYYTTAQSPNSQSGAPAAIALPTAAAAAAAAAAAGWTQADLEHAGIGNDDLPTPAKLSRTEIANGALTLVRDSSLDEPNSVTSPAVVTVRALLQRANRASDDDEGLPQHATLAPATAYYTSPDSGSHSPTKYQENGHDTFSDFVTLVCQEASSTQASPHPGSRSPKVSMAQSYFTTTSAAAAAAAHAANVSEGSTMYPPPPPAPMARPVTIIRTTGDLPVSQSGSPPMATSPTSLVSADAVHSSNLRLSPVSQHHMSSHSDSMTDVPPRTVLFTYSGGSTQGINLSGQISPTTLSLITNPRLTAVSSGGTLVNPASIRAVMSSGLVSSTPTLRWTTAVTSSSPTSSTTFMPSIEENISYDQLPVMSPMLATNSNESGNGGQVLMDDDRYFRCEPMDATDSPIALTIHGSHGGQGNTGDNSNGSSSNPGTPTN